MACLGIEKEATSNFSFIFCAINFTAQLKIIRIMGAGKFMDLFPLSKPQITSS